MISTVILWLFVLNLGIAFGAGLYETRIAVPRWLPGSPQAGYRWNRAAALEDNVGLRFWVYVSTLPLTLLTLASLIAPWWVTGPLRAWWLAAALAALLDRGHDFRLLYSHHADPDAQRRFFRIGRRPESAPMGTIRIFTPCSHADRVVGGPEGVFVVPRRLLKGRAAPAEASARPAESRV